MAKHIFVTGGVVSSLGKGLTCASIGMLLEHRGLRVRLQKFDPYINVDPGTMSPYQHGEVYVLDDGAETDLDLGHYERFTQAKLTRDCNYTTGKIYLSVIQKEREGKHYEGRTVQVPYLRAAGELKTKPTQHSVGALRQIGIQPDILISRTEHSISEDDKNKIALFCNIERRAVIEEKDKEYSIYEVPLSLVNNGLDDLIVKKLNLKAGALDISDWRELVDRVLNPAKEVRIAVVGKYMKHRDAYKSVYESLDHAGIANRARVILVRVEAEEVSDRGAEGILGGVDGILVPGGFGMRGVEGKIEAIRYARTRGIPFFGICLGMQCASVEFARSILRYDDANSTEFDKNTSHPVISLMEEQTKVQERGATMRLGACPCDLVEGSLARKAYGQPSIHERHRHRYEFNNAYRKAFEEHGFRPTGMSPDGSLVEIMELADHPWFLAVQFHPEFQSKPTKAHPLFSDFIAAALKRRESNRGEQDGR